MCTPYGCTPPCTRKPYPIPSTLLTLSGVLLCTSHITHTSSRGGNAWQPRQQQGLLRIHPWVRWPWALLGQDRHQGILRVGNGVWAQRAGFVDQFLSRALQSQDQHQGSLCVASKRVGSCLGGHCGECSSAGSSVRGAYKRQTRLWVVTALGVRLSQAQ